MNFEISKNGNHHLEKSTQAAEFIETSKPFDFRATVQLFLEKWPLMLKTSLAAAVVAFCFVWFSPETYQAKAVLQVDQEELRLIGTDTVVPQDLKSPEALNTIVHNVKNSSVLRRVILDNELDANPLFLGKRSKKPVSETRLIGALRSMITVKLRPETRLIDIMVSHRDPVLAQKLANSVAQEFIRQNLYDRFSTSKAANGLLYEEAERLKARLEKSEKEIQAYKEATQTVFIDDRQNVLVEKLKELSRKFTEAQTQRLALQADLSQIDSTKTNPAAVLALPIVQADPAVAELGRKIVEQEAALATLKIEYQPTFPKVVKAEAQLGELHKILQNFAEKVRSSVNSSYTAALAREKNLEAALKGSETEALALDKKAVGYSVRFRELQSDRALYDSVLKRLKETDLSKGLGQASLAMVEPAITAAPQNVSPLLLIGGSFFLAFFVTVALLYFARAVKGSIYTVDDAENSLGVPVWAAIPSMTNGSVKTLPHILTDNPGSICAESFRMLRTNASTGLLPAEKKILIFTSADPGEGKTFCSVNYAICQAQEGKKTLLIDLDLRRPSVGQNFNLPPKIPGVTDCLVKGRSLKSVLQPTSYPDLYVLPAGPKIAHPAEELSKGSLLDLLSEASTQFDRIIIDSAPVNVVSDTFLVLPFADIVCLVVRSGSTSRRGIKRAIELMMRANIEPSGIVLNYLPQQRGYGSYYHYSAEYHDVNGDDHEIPATRRLLDLAKTAAGRH